MSPERTDRTARKARTRAAIIAAARDRFVAVGYDATTMRDVARTAGVAVGTIHAHFPDKTALLFACFYDQIAGAVALGLESVDPDAPLPEQLVHLARVLYAAYARHPALSRVMFQASLFPPPDARSDPMLTAFLGEVAGLFRAARDRGEIARLLDDGAMGARLYFSLYLMVLIGGLAGLYSADDDPDAAERWADALRPLVVAQLVGFGLPSPPEAS